MSESWSERQRGAAQQVDEQVSRVLGAVAGAAWGGRPGRDWALRRDLDEASWRAYRYLGSTGPAEHRYAELGVRAVVDPEGRIVAFQVDNGSDFMALHDPSPANLERGLRHLLQATPPVRTYAEPVYRHRTRRYGDLSAARGCWPF